MGNPFCHVELSTTDTEKAKSFYSDLFSWELQDVPMGPDMTYTLINPNGGTGGGLVRQMNPGAPSAWLSYVLVDDIDASTEKAQSLGAKVIRPVTEVPGTGWLSIITDPTGAVLGLWEAAPRSGGAAT